ncbi:MFS general substrate transporter [Myriangium duriaei CBS 260.36]|uniref:MFS general substrate transporter n=1 Tax=Myriangium duriaei CBS 260.36 TaxID=1168546 RepID=A0A9P4J9H7_9PEZI|nr:MFS general substrate transporter [Myriangium duriaei CBS 260.36]
MLTSICKEYWQFILAQGVFGGICNGLIFSPALATVGHYFNKKRGAALGMVAVGSSIGGTIFPIVLQQSFYGRVGFGWGVRATAFVMLFLLAIACALIVERLPPRKGRIFAPEAFLQPSYILVLIGVFFLFWGLFLIFFFVSEYAMQDVHMGSSLSFYLLSIINGASLFGRMTFGILGDKVGFLSLLAFVGLINGIIVLCWTTATTNAGLIVWCIFFGFGSGGIFSLFPAAIVQVTSKPQYIGTYIGQGMVFFAIAGLTGSPISGAIVTKYGYLDGSLFAGVSLLVGFVFLVGARFAFQPSWTVKA